MSEVKIVLIALYRYQNFPVRIMHAVLEALPHVEPHSIFLKNYFENTFNEPTPTEEALFVQQITKLKPDIVGISLLSPYVNIAKRLTNLVKEHTRALVVWGGTHPTIDPETCVGEADIICIGEGEGAIADLAERLRDGQPITDIRNLWVNTQGGVVKNPMRPLIEDLDDVPFPAYGRDSFCFIDNNRMRSNDPTLLYDIFFVLGSRGCPFSCSYCANSVLRKQYKGLGRYVRRRSAKNVVAEIKQDSANGQNRGTVLFYDEVFSLDSEWLDEFCRLYKDDVGLPFYAQYNPNTPASKVIPSIEKLVSAGLSMINLGIQSGNDHIRNNIFQRPGKNENIVRLANEIARHKVTINYDLIIDNPYDTIETLEETTALLLRLPKPLSFHLYALQFFPEYPLTHQAIIDGHITEQEAGSGILLQKTTRNWAFKPRLFPLRRKQMLQNVIWLVVRNMSSDKVVRFAVSGRSTPRYLALLYLSIKAATLGPIIGVGGFFDKHKRAVQARNCMRKYMLLTLAALKYLLKGDLHSFATKTAAALRGRSKRG